MKAATIIRVDLADDAYDITIEPGVLGRLGGIVREVAQSPTAFLAVDDRITASHGAAARRSLEEAGFHVIESALRAEETAKTLPSVHALYDAMLAGDVRLDRGSPVVAVGGGIVGDTAGFVAATFMRGVPLVGVPTTLLAMVDASIGGKTGVNLQLPDGSLAKNMIGAFWQPRAVVVDPEVLGTLDRRDLQSGLAECVKHGLIADASLLELLAGRAQAILGLETDALLELIERCARIKVEIVRQDPRESGRRALLNLGHTFAHALEFQPGLGLRHGEAVSIGLVAAARCATATGRLDEAGEQRIAAVLDGLGLPQRVPSPVPIGDLMRAMTFDKKAAAGRRRLVLPVAIGDAAIVDDVPDDVVEAAWAHVGAARIIGR